ncbi:MAG: ATP12 family protein [Alphaproteobacteria bacterium]
MKKFYKSADIGVEGNKWSVLLDGLQVKTPGKISLRLPSQSLAEAIALEWNSQGETVVPDKMPLTQYACSAIDRVAPARGAVITQVAEYAGTDLICYPSHTPKDLRSRQDTMWLPLIELLTKMGWKLQQTSSLMPILNGAENVLRAEEWLETQSDMKLTSLASLIETSGSFYLTYLYAFGLLDITKLVASCTIEDRFNLESWGSDEEAEQLLQRREEGLRSAAQMFDLLQKAS